MPFHKVLLYIKRSAFRSLPFWSGAKLGTQIYEKISKQYGTFFFPHAGNHLRVMVKVHGK
jgi:hypothetical protein